MPDIHEQETLTETDVISLLQDDTPSSTPSRKGYADYAREAKAEAATSDAETNKGVQDDKAESSGFKMPEKFQGKTAEEIAASYAQLESEFGRRNTEVGSLRKLTDQLLELNTTPQVPVEPKKATTVDDLLNNPDETITSAVEGNPRLRAIEERLLASDRATAKADFESKHPDWETKMGTEDFATWILQSPMRQRLFKEANTNYDYATGAELLDLYNLAKGNVVQDAKEQRNTQARAAAKGAVTETGGANEPKAKPRFRREELIQLKLRNPQKYESMKKTIMEAYADKRVI